MKSVKRGKLIFAFLAVVIIAASVLPVILRDDAAITVNSAPAIVFAACNRNSVHIVIKCIQVTIHAVNCVTELIVRTGTLVSCQFSISSS